MSMFSIASSNSTPGLRHRLLERVEVHDDQVDELDPVRRRLRQVLGLVAAAQQARRGSSGAASSPGPP